MKKFLLLFFIIIQALSSKAFKLNATFDYAFFKTSTGETYVETCLLVHGLTYHLKKMPDNNLNGLLEVTMIFSKDNKVSYYDKYKLTTGTLSSIDSTKLNILDMKRIALAAGNYRIDIIINDLNDPELKNKIEYADSVVLEFRTDKPNFSYLQFIEKTEPASGENVLNRGNIRMYPQLNGYFGEQNKKLMFYTELYDTEKFFGKDEKFVVQYGLQYFENNLPVKDMMRLEKFTTKPIVPLLANIDITNLLPGNYNLLVEIRDKNNQIVTNSMRFFQKGGVLKTHVTEDLSEVGTEFMTYVNNLDTLKEYIQCLRPIASQLEVAYGQNVFKSGDIELMKKYLVSFWLAREPKNAEGAWIKYRKQVSIVEKLFNTQFLRSYDTDRGRVFLQYGPPNQRSTRPNEPNAYPYEIWQYYKLKNQTNRTFVFYNKEAATNNYELLHSDAIGERKTENWQWWISNRGRVSQDIDSKKPDATFGGMANDLQRNPR